MSPDLRICRIWTSQLIKENLFYKTGIYQGSFRKIEKITIDPVDGAKGNALRLTYTCNPDCTKFVLSLWFSTKNAALVEDFGFRTDHEKTLNHNLGHNP